MFNSGNLVNDTNGDAVVEAAILFPIMIMIFAALVLLAIYLPTRAALQRATQYAATVLATERSDTWLFYDESSMAFYWEDDKERLKNVYAALFSSDDIQDKGEDIVIEVENRGVSSKAGNLTVECSIFNKVVYKEVVITATREFAMPIDLSFISFPKTILVTATSTAAVQSGDDFIRNMDLGAEFAGYISEKFGLSDIADSISSFGGKIASILGW